MFDVGWTEMLVIAAVAVMVIGPKDVPRIMYQVGRFFRRLQYMKFAMSQQFDEVLRAGDIEELRRGVNFEAPQDNVKITPPRDRDEAEADADADIVAHVDTGAYQPPDAEVVEENPAQETKPEARP